jgi:cytochrome c553
MKKLTLVSVVVASLLLVGCNDDKAVDTKVAVVEKVEVATTEKSESLTDKATKAVDAVKEVASSAVTKTSEAATEVKEAVKEKATAAIESSKEVANDAKDAVEKKVAEVKEVVAEKVAEAKEAVTPKEVVVPAAYAACAGCHGKDGKLKALGKSVIIAGQAKADLVTKLNGYKAGTLNVSGMGALMKGQAEKLSDADIEAIATYVSGM